MKGSLIFDEIKGLETIIVIFEDLKWIILQEFTF